MATVAVPDGSVRAAQQRSLIVLIVFVLVCAAKVVTVQALLLGGVTPLGVASDIAFVFLVFASVDLLFPDMRYDAFTLTDIALAGLMLAIALFQRYYGALPTLEALRGLGQVATVGAGLGRLYSPVMLLVFADLPFFLGWSVYARRRGVDPATGSPTRDGVTGTSRTPYVYQRRRVYVIAVLLGVLLALGIGQERESVARIDNSAVARQRGLLTYLAVAIGGPGGEPMRAVARVDAAQTQIDALRGGSSPTRAEGFASGMAVGAHVIVVQVEALQSLAIGSHVGTQAVTPELDRLIGRSWYFPNAFTQVGLGTTADAEFVSATSLLGPRGGSSSMLYSNRVLSSLPRSLAAEEGYDVLTFHTNNVRYWNRSQLYPAIGYGQYFDARYFGSDDRVAFGASDEVLYRKTAEELKRRSEAGKTFYASVVSMSSHYPFISLPMEKRALKLTPELEGTLLGDYLVNANYADRQLGAFIDRLERDGLLDRSVLVVYGDHFAMEAEPKGKDAVAISGLLGGRAYSPVDHLNVPLIVRLPGQEEGVVSSLPVGQVDIAPTIADAIGMVGEPSPRFGRSAFSGGPVLFPAGGTLPPGAYFDDDVLYIPGNDFASGAAWGILERRRVPLSRASAAKYEAALQMSELSDRYVNSLPKRDDYDPSAGAILPN